MAWFYLPPRSDPRPDRAASSVSGCSCCRRRRARHAGRAAREPAPIAAGAGVQLLFALVFLRAHPVWRPPVSASLVVLYLIALAWAYVPTRGHTDWAVHVAQGVLLLGGRRAGRRPRPGPDRGRTAAPGEQVVRPIAGPHALAAPTGRLPARCPRWPPCGTPCATSRGRHWRCCPTPGRRCRWPPWAPGVSPGLAAGGS